MTTPHQPSAAAVPQLSRVEGRRECLHLSTEELAHGVRTQRCAVCAAQPVEATFSTTLRAGAHWGGALALVLGTLTSALLLGPLLLSWYPVVDLRENWAEAGWIFSGLLAAGVLISLPIRWAAAHSSFPIRFKLGACRACHADVQRASLLSRGVDAVVVLAAGVTLVGVFVGYDLQYLTLQGWAVSPLVLLAVDGAAVLMFIALGVAAFMPSLLKDRTAWLIRRGRSGALVSVPVAWAREMRSRDARR